jgi:hypothetical protein
MNGSAFLLMLGFFASGQRTAFSHKISATAKGLFFAAALLPFY